jgi:transcriptional regulator NrdR family protein
MCPSCGSLDTKVVDSRFQFKEDLAEELENCPTCKQAWRVKRLERVPVVMRRRQCVCGLRFKTFERVDLENYLNREYRKAGIPPKERL